MTDVTTTSATNRRQFLRVVPDALAPVRVDITGVDFFDICKAYDISEGGARILVPHRFEGCQIDGPVELTIHLPEPVSKAFKTEGLIRHISADSFGVRFTSIDEKGLGMVRDYVAAWLRSNEGMLEYLRYKLNRMK